MRFISGTIQGAFWGKSGGRFRDRRELEAWQKNQLKRHLSFVVANSPYYKDRPRSAMDIKEFQHLDKNLLMENFSQMNTVGLTRDAAFSFAEKSESSRDFSGQLGSVSVGLSTGTSGRRGLFLASAFERGFWAGYILRRLLPRGLMGRSRVALFLRSNSSLYTSTSQARVAFEYFDLTRPFPSLFEQLVQFCPTVVVAPPSILSILCSMAASQKISPELIVSVADVLEDSEKKRIEKEFGCQVKQIYQATEGLLGVSCELGAIHLCEDLVYFEREWLGNGRFSPIITDLRKRTLPLVRYRMNDVLVESSKACACGSPFVTLSKIEGRQDNIIIGRKMEGVGLVSIFPDFVRALLSKRLDTLDVKEDYFVRQTSIGTLEVGLIGANMDDDLQGSLKFEIQKLFQNSGCLSPAIQFRVFDKAAQTYKRTRVLREIPLENLNSRMLESM